MFAGLGVLENLNFVEESPTKVDVSEILKSDLVVIARHDSHHKSASWIASFLAMTEEPIASFLAMTGEWIASFLAMTGSDFAMTAFGIKKG